MVVEVASSGADADKARAYAERGIPVYLLIDRDTCETVVYGEPENGAYASRISRPFGKQIVIPSPVGITMDTEPLKNWVR